MPDIIPPVPVGADFQDDVVYQFLEELRSQVNRPVYFAQATDPGTTGVKNGQWSMWLNTTSGVLKIWANQNGTMKSVTLT